MQYTQQINMYTVQCTVYVQSIQGASFVNIMIKVPGGIYKLLTVQTIQLFSISNIYSIILVHLLALFLGTTYLLTYKMMYIS